jgi:hypothetical protein
LPSLLFSSFVFALAAREWNTHDELANYNSALERIAYEPHLGIHQQRLRERSHIMGPTAFKIIFISFSIATSTSNFLNQKVATKK